MVLKENSVHLHNKSVVANTLVPIAFDPEKCFGLELHFAYGVLL